jgi:uncharacterized Fe-S cluster-containing protein
VLEHTLSEEERSQIVQTIEMFEVITQTQPDDYQSLEILKEGYRKIGRLEESFRVSRRLAEAYYNVGSYTLALQECEVILLREPNSPEILALQGEIENKLQLTGKKGEVGAHTGLIATDLVAGGANGASLIEMPETRHRLTHELQERGDDQLAKFLIVQQLFSEEEVTAALETVKTLNKDLAGQTLAASLVEKLGRQDTDKVDAVLSSLIDRTKFAYVPLEYYDVDRQVARMLPDHLTLGRLFVPFDLISRTIMIACCNPFDVAGREAVQQSLDYTVAWYLSRPGAIVKSLQDIYRLDTRPA